MKKNLYFVFSFILFFISSYVSAAGDPAAGQQKSAVCTACHGPAGVSAVPMWPKLAGQHAEYTYKQLLDFKTGKRENAQMAPMVAALSEQDMWDIAAYYAQQEPNIGVVEPGALSVGEKLYRVGNEKTGLAACMSCHGPNGAGNPAAKYPSLSGQHSTYTETTLKDFKSEIRSNDQNATMRSVASKMTNAEIKALSDYVQGLH